MDKIQREELAAIKSRTTQHNVDSQAATATSTGPDNFWHLRAMNRTMRNIYGGTVDGAVKADRRERGKRARKARRINRRRK